LGTLYARLVESELFILCNIKAQEAHYHIGEYCLRS